MRTVNSLFVVLALAALAADAKPRLALQESIELLQRADGATDHELVASAIDAIRALRGEAAPAAPTLAALLRHQSKLYTDRDRTLVVRLRSYVMVTLGDIGYPTDALPALLETLANLDQRMPPVEAGAAARAAGSLGTRGRPFVPYLVSALTIERFDAEEFSLERYEPLYPQAEATTVRLEAIRALGRICTAEDRHAIEALAALTGAGDARVARESKRAAELIRNRRTQ